MQTRVVEGTLWTNGQVNARARKEGRHWGKNGVAELARRTRQKRNQNVKGRGIKKNETREKELAPK